jgi:heat shock protein HslJ
MLQVGPYGQACGEQAPFTCVMVREDLEEEWFLLAEPIEGFAFEPGFHFVLECHVETVDDPGGGRPRRRYVLLDVIHQSLAAPDLEAAHTGSLAGTAWRLVELADASVRVWFEGEPEVTVDFLAGGQVNGFGGCNSFGGQYEQPFRYEVRVGGLHQTQAECEQPLAGREQEFLDALAKAERFSIWGDMLQLTDWTGRQLMLLEPRAFARPGEPSPPYLYD